VTQPGVGFQQLPGVGLQQMPPGLGNSMDNIVAARGIFQQMNPRKLQVVFQEINQRWIISREFALSVDLCTNMWPFSVGVENCPGQSRTMPRWLAGVLSHIA